MAGRCGAISWVVSPSGWKNGTREGQRYAVLLKAPLVIAGASDQLAEARSALAR